MFILVTFIHLDAQAEEYSFKNLSSQSYEQEVSGTSDGPGLEFLKINEVKFSQSCCKVCITGKACGDSCISKSYKCYKGVGCACDG